MSHLHDLHALQREHADLQDWFLLPSDRTSHGLRRAQGMLTSARLASRRFYRPQTGYGALSGPELQLCLSDSAFALTLRDERLLGLMEQASQSRNGLVFVAPAMSEDFLATLAINAERNTLSALALLADPAEVRRLARVLGVPVAAPGGLEVGTVYLDEILATAHGAALLAHGGNPLGLVSVGAPCAEAMWGAWQQMSDALAG